MPTYQVHSIDDPAVQVYRDLCEKEGSPGPELFVAEGEHLVRRLSLPIVRADDFPGQLRWLRDRQRAELIATVADEAAQPLHEVARSERVVLLLGTEADGLDPRLRQLCQRRVTVPMSPGVDSLNVAMAAGICLYHFARRG